MRKLVKNGIYKHFKGDCYIVIDTAIDSDDINRVLIIYRALYGEGKLFVREYNDFLGEVDHIKYPNVKQKYKFELQKIESVR